MRAHSTIRLNVHLDAENRPTAWGLLVFTTNARGIPSARLVQHGRIDLDDLEAAGLDRVAALLFHAASRMA